MELMEVQGMVEVMSLVQAVVMEEQVGFTEEEAIVAVVGTILMQDRTKEFLMQLLKLCLEVSNYSSIKPPLELIGTFSSLLEVSYQCQ